MNNTAENNSKNSNDINENSKSLRKLSVVVSVYNEEKALREFYKETNKILEQIRKSGWEHELIFVNDGSSDNSLSILEELAKEDHDVKLISFSRYRRWDHLHGCRPSAPPGMYPTDHRKIQCRLRSYQHGPYQKQIRRSGQKYNIIRLLLAY